MIVDLLRNDLSKVCRPGSVEVPALCALESHPTVHHLESIVTGRLEEGRTAADLLRAAFPGGSITGAPKVRAMEILAELEPVARGVYCGAIGWLSVTGAMDTSIAIRTVTLQDGRATFHAGGGIVADSDAGPRVPGDARQGRRHPPRLRGGAMILLLDNYDSFVWNLARYVRELGGEPLVLRNDAVTLDDVAGLAPSHIIISPGPCTPSEAGMSLDVIRRFGATIPTLGVCLGHQAIGAAYGGRVVRASRPMHGKTSDISHDGTGLFAGLPSPFKATRYHSLALERGSLPGRPASSRRPRRTGRSWRCATGRIPVVGTQFHPESVLTEGGHAIVGRFLDGGLVGGAASQSPKLMPMSRAVWRVSESRGTSLVRPMTSTSGTVEMVGGV